MAQFFNQTPPTEAQKKNRDRFFLVVIFSLVFLMAIRSPLDNDMWWHLRAGETTWQTGRPILADIYSFTRYGTPWTNVYWLFQAGMYLLYRAGGFTLLAVMVALLAALSLILLTFQMEGPVLFKGFLLILTALVSSPVWSARPQVGSLVLISLVGYILYLYKWRRRDHLWALIPIFILWANTHPGYVYGLMLIAAMLAGEVINHLVWPGSEENLPWKAIFRLGLWGLAGGFALLINPSGIRAWLLPFQTVGFNAVQFDISEWSSPNFHQFFQQPFIWMVLLTVIAIGFSQRRLDGSDLVVFAMFTYLSLVARRNFGPFALATTPILARYGWPALAGWEARIRGSVESLAARLRLSPTLLTGLSATNDKRSRVINLSVFALLALASAGRLGYATSPSVMQAGLASTYPVSALAWIEAHHPPGYLFNSYNWGGYLLWSERDYPVFVDGRTDIYGDAIINQWMTVANGNDGWQKILDQWNIHLILLEPGWPITQKLTDYGWKILYQNSNAMLFGR